MGRNNFGYQGYAIAFAPSDPTRIYMIGTGSSDRAQSFWVSDDRGRTFTETSKRDIGSTVSADDRRYGYKLAVDPANPDVVYFGDSAGIIFRTLDGGDTFERVDDLIDALTTAATNGTTSSASAVLNFASTPAAIAGGGSWQQMFAYDVTTPGAVGTGIANLVLSSNATTVTMQRAAGAFVAGTPGVGNGDTIAFGSGPVIAFDPDSGTTGGRTNRIFFGWAYGAAGVWETDDAGATFSGPMADSPVTVQRMKFSSDGVCYATDNDRVRLNNAWRFQSDAWSNLAVNSINASTAFFRAVAPDPTTPGRVVLGTNNGNINRSDDYGDAFYGMYANAALREAVNIQWHEYTNEDSMSTADMTYDPLVANKLWFAEGIGVWYTSPLTSNAQPTWTEHSVGNEELIVNQMLAPPGGGVLCAVQDRGVMLSSDPEEYPATNFAPAGAVTALHHCWAIDYAKNDPTFIMAVVTGVIYTSANGGATWTVAAASPGGLAGALAVWSTTNAVWIPLNDTSPKYTTNGGVNWTNCTFDGGSLTTGWSFDRFLVRHLLCVDAAGHYFAFNQTNGVYKSTDGGATFVLVHNTTGLLTDSGVGLTLRAVPGNAGHLFLAFGAISGPASSERRMVRSSDGGVTWSEISSTWNVWMVALGMTKPGSSYPTIFIAGEVEEDGTAGIWRCTDATTDPEGELTWTLLTDAPADILDAPHSLAASLDTYGRAYVGFGASGAAYNPLPTSVRIRVNWA
jgi:hypothetical protein